MEKKRKTVQCQWGIFFINSRQDMAGHGHRFPSFVPVDTIWGGITWDNHPLTSYFRVPAHQGFDMFWLIATSLFAFYGFLLLLPPLRIDSLSGVLDRWKLTGTLKIPKNARAWTCRTKLNYIQTSTRPEFTIWVQTCSNILQVSPSGEGQSFKEIDHLIEGPHFLHCFMSISMPPGLDFASPVASELFATWRHCCDAWRSWPSAPWQHMATPWHHFS